MINYCNLFVKKKTTIFGNPFIYIFEAYRIIAYSPKNNISNSNS